MTRDDVVIELRNISRAYALYQNPVSRLKEALNPFGKKYHNLFYALNDITLQVKRGEILGIVGRNGSGKSTLLKLVSKILPPTTGELNVNGNVVALLELGSSFNPEYTGLQNLYFYGSVLGFTRKQMDARIEEILDFAGIGDFIHQPVKTYSSGMKVRLAFAVSINVNPDILILDEVLAVGDELFRRKCYAKMEQILRSDKTVLYVSHNAPNIIELCTRAILLDKGELLLEGSPKLVVAQYQRYLYAAPQNASDIRQEIKYLNGDENTKLKYASSLEESARKEAKFGEGTRGFPKVPDLALSEKENQKAFLLPELISKTFIEYKQYDVAISDVHIKTLSGQKVNALVIDDEYIFAYKVKFNLAADNVQVTLGFKTEKGLSLGWAAAPGKWRYIERVANGEEYLVEWRFHCHFLPGNYYINLGVKSLANGKKMFLNRIVDAFVFKVQPVSDSLYGGFVHFNQRATISRIL
jgi:lipopolysaccharide transport system ATP-binding protein